MSEVEAEQTRTDEITDVLNGLCDEHEKFQKGDTAYPGETFDLAVTDVDLVIHSGDWPKQTIGVCKKVGAFLESWNRYRGGAWNRDYSPKNEVWSTLREVIEEFELVKTPVTRTIEPVHILLEQMKDYAARYKQIAKMYGWRVETRPGQYKWAGPFFDGNGVEVTGLIEQEGKTPGSVIPEGWRPDDEVERETRRSKEVRNRLSNARKRLDSAAKAHEVDPASIEDLLFEGQFPDVIAKVKKVPLADVHATAGNLGIEPNSRDNAEPWVDPRKTGKVAPNATAGGGEGIQSIAPPAPTKVVEIETEEPAADETPKEMSRRELRAHRRELVALVLETLPDAGAAEISRAIKDAHGEDVSVRSVAMILKDRQTTAAAD
ncbi:hypothetical protein K0U83_21420 [bacterium]|nr:hypothetical protein [bacterium]